MAAMEGWVARGTVEDIMARWRRSTTASLEAIAELQDQLAADREKLAKREAKIGQLEAELTVARSSRKPPRPRPQRIPPPRPPPSALEKAELRQIEELVTGLMTEILCRR